MVFWAGFKSTKFMAIFVNGANFCAFLGFRGIIVFSYLRLIFVCNRIGNFNLYIFQRSAKAHKFILDKYIVNYRCNFIWV